MKRILLIAGVLLLLGGTYTAWHLYQWIYAPNTQPADNQILLVAEGNGVDSVIASLQRQHLLINEDAFRWVARRMKFGDNSIKDGRYYIPAGLSNYALIQKLRLGEQDAVDLVINSASTLEALAGIVGRQLECDSLTFLRYVRDTYLPQSDYTSETILSLFIPNTYEVWWNLKPERLLKRMESEHERFWNASRIAAADSLGMSPTEVYTLASIVEMETQVQDERKTIAGVYLNRLKEGIALQADPTVRFILSDSSVRRILHRHLEIESPYNTYLHTGLPPGPIAMPSIHSIDAVLHPEQHEYIFFCAQPGYQGRHLFARTLSAHLNNARAYQSWLDQQGIR